MRKREVFADFCKAQIFAYFHSSMSKIWTLQKSAKTSRFLICSELRRKFNVAEASE